MLRSILCENAVPFVRMNINSAPATAQLGDSAAFCDIAIEEWCIGLVNGSSSAFRLRRRACRDPPTVVSPIGQHVGTIIHE